MILPDANVLLYTEYRAWLDDLVNGDEAFGM